MTAYYRHTGRALPCVNSDNTDYREHRMKTVYVRASMVVVEDSGGGRAQTSKAWLTLQSMTLNDFTLAMSDK